MRRFTPCPPGRGRRRIGAAAVGALFLLLLPSLALGAPSRIGLIVPTSGARREEGIAVRRGAEMAVAEANAHGQRYELVVRTDDGLWGKGVREVTRLAFDDRVCGIIGGIESASGHIIEQVAMKARIPFITPWAGDRTLTSAGVPFVFRCVPDDLQQAQALSRLVFVMRRLPRVGVVASDDRSARREAAVFAAAAEKAGHSIPSDCRWLIPDPSAGGKAANLGRNVPVSGQVTPEPAAIAAALRARLPAIVVFGPLALGGRLAAARERGPGIQVITPEAVATLSSGFRKRFRARYGVPATAPAAYAYDSLRVLIRAIYASRSATGPQGDAVRQAIARTTMAGVTGPISFDRSGNRRVPRQ